MAVSEKFYELVTPADDRRAGARHHFLAETWQVPHRLGPPQEGAPGAWDCCPCNGLGWPAHGMRLVLRLLCVDSAEPEDRQQAPHNDAEYLRLFALRRQRRLEHSSARSGALDTRPDTELQIHDELEA
jgi:hypothetical protein